MNFDWINDGRKIPDSVMYYIRVMAVNAIRILGQSPEIIAVTYNFNRACIYRWLKQYDEGGFDALKSDTAPGAPLVITSEMDEWLKQTILNQTPIDFEYDTNLWTCKIIIDLLKAKFGITVGESAVRSHLKNLKLSFQKPEYQDAARNEQEIEHFLTYIERVLIVES